MVLRRSSPALVAAADSTQHPHLLRPLDVLADGDGVLVVVTDGPAGERLDVWARRRGTMSGGEAVTILLPVIAAVAHLARRGTVLDDVGLEQVEVDGRGAPVLVGGRVARLGAQPPGSVPGGALALVRAVARELPPHERDRLTDEMGTEASVEELVERVHDLARPVPLPTVVPSADTAASRVEWRPPPAEPTRSGWTSVLPESALLDGLADWWEAVSAVPVLGRLRSVRPRSWVLGGLVVLSLVVGAAVVPGNSGSDVPSADTVQPAPTPSTGSTSDAAPPDGDPGAVASVHDGAADDPVSQEETAVRGDDAIAAATVLLRARVTCAREPSTSCLADVDQAGSPVSAGDSLVLTDIEAVDDLVLPTDVVSEVQRLGETVLLACRTSDDEPASVLVVRTEAGWRLREVLRG